MSQKDPLEIEAWDKPCAVPRRAVLAGLAALVTASATRVSSPAVAQQAPPKLGRTPQKARAPAPIEVVAKPIASFGRVTPARRMHGRLEFRGGLTLSSTHPNFGGLSGLVMSDDGRQMLAVTDRAWWLSAEIGYDGARPIGLDHARIGETPGQGGLVLRGRDRDSEAITMIEGNLARGTALIGFERNHRIARYQIVDGGIGQPLGTLRLPADARRMKSNSGFEAVTVVRSGPLRGSIIAFGEEYRDTQGNNVGWIWAGLGAAPQQIGLTNIGDFAVTDAATLPDGNLVVLERKFRWLEGLKMRLRLIKAATVRPGAVLEGEVLLEADLSSEIDNMEGLAISRDSRGLPVLTLISDNNFNGLLQRTILLQFALLPDNGSKVQPTSTTRPR